MHAKIALLLLSFFVFSCSQNTERMSTSIQEEKSSIQQAAKPSSYSIDTKQFAKGFKKRFYRQIIASYPDSALVNIMYLDSSFIFDIRYASTNNFMNYAVYDCENCFLRKKVAEALLVAKDSLLAKGYRIKFFDCYRPYAAQFVLYEKASKKAYVANPEKGSWHNKGAAIDLTLTDMKGKELDMGTEYDFFGIQAHHTYTQLPEQVLKNRIILKSAMEKAGFASVKSEWWHYSYYKGGFRLLNEKMPCDD